MRPASASSSGLRDRTNCAVARGKAKALITNKGRLGAAEDVAELENALVQSLDALAGSLDAFKESSRVALSSLARLMPPGSIDQMLPRIKEVAQTKNHAVSLLHEDFLSLRTEIIQAVPFEENLQVNSESHQCSVRLPQAFEIDGVVEKTLSFLDIKTILKTQFVCRRFARATRSESLWRTIVIRDFEHIARPLIRDGVLTKSPQTSGQVSFRQMIRERFQADAIVRKWSCPKMRSSDNSETEKLVAYKPRCIHILAWLKENDKINATTAESSYLTKGIIIPEFFKFYEEIVLEEYERRDREGGNFQDEPVLLPKVPAWLSSSASKFHDRARRAVIRIYLKKNGELLRYQSSFSYVSDHALWLSSTGPKLSESQIISTFGQLRNYYKNEAWSSDEEGGDESD